MLPKEFRDLARMGCGFLIMYLCIYTIDSCIFVMISIHVFIDEHY